MKRALAVLLLSVALGGCERAVQDMYDQPRHKPLGASRDLPGGASAQPLPQDSVPHSKGNSADVASGKASAEVVAADRYERARGLPATVSAALIERGRERYSIYCTPCHSPLGDGDGLIVQRGFPRPPSYHTARLREAPDRHFYDVISQGYGIMYPYADRVAPEDRWAIVAYIRALQLSHSAPADRLPPDVRARLEAAR